MEEIKLAIINGESNEYDGKINCFYIDEQELFHSNIFSKYIKENYSPNELENLDFDNANSMMLFLRERGNIVFVNDTTYKNGIPDKHGKTGIFAMPDFISENQISALKEFNKMIKTYDGLQIWHSFDSHIECKNLFTKDKSQVKGVIDFYIENYAKSKVK